MCFHFADANVSKPSGIPGSSAAFDNALYQGPSLTPQSSKVQ